MAPLRPLPADITAQAHLAEGDPADPDAIVAIDIAVDGAVVEQVTLTAGYLRARHAAATGVPPRVTPSSGNVFLDLGAVNPTAKLREARARSTDMAAPIPAGPIADAAIDAAFDRYLTGHRGRAGRDAFRDVVRALLTEQRAAIFTGLAALDAFSAAQAGEEAALAEEPHYAGEASAADRAATEPTAGHFRERGAIIHAFRTTAGVKLPGGEYVDARRWVVTRGDGATETYSHEHFAHRFEYVGD